ncbi:LysR family transcriptional regulator [Cupriavidus sp. 2SB]|uniref:LysR family transcriptional regulator n=1 Tax=Cupriavidus sp. 2SB TaxID=2502199 RepID=UPI0010F9724B|nr:LysR family transcriptional regulator [Cupriavidus sp. 2SB]
MKFHHLRDFIAIAESRSIRGAAKKLGMAQPALSRSLRDLEGIVGAALLERHAKGVVPTEIGQAFLVRATAALAELNRAQDEITQMLGSYVGTVTVGMSSSVWLSLGADVHKAFRRRFPDMRLRMYEGFFPTMESKLQNGTLDFYVGPRPETTIGDGYTVDLLYHHGKVVTGRQGHPKRYAESLADLMDEEWLLTGLRERAERELEEIFSEHGLPLPKTITQAETMVGIAALICETDALAVLPWTWVKSPLFVQVAHPFKLKEKISAPDIVKIARTAVPLTPAASYMSSLFERFARQASFARLAQGA